MQGTTVGWDIGGAHVKAAEINGADEILTLIQQRCPLWKGIARLHDAVHIVNNALSGSVRRHVITMTGELVDLFDNRADGVKQIIDAMTALLARQEVLIYAGKSGFLRPGLIEQRHFQDIASANWLASATLAAKKTANGLLVDIGSTTTDLLVISNGCVLTEGYSDYQRLQSQELVYTGIVRTPVMAVAQTVLDEGRETGLMAEYFATMADVYRVTGDLNERHDQTDTADGAEKTLRASARRLSRMIGCDIETDDNARWLRFAAQIKKLQLQQIQRSCVKLITQHDLADNCPLIGAGIGRFLVKQLAVNLGRAYVDFCEFSPTLVVPNEFSAADCAPAVAVACLKYLGSE